MSSLRLRLSSIPYVSRVYTHTPRRGSKSLRCVVQLSCRLKFCFLAHSLLKSRNYSSGKTHQHTKTQEDLNFRRMTIASHVLSISACSFRHKRRSGGVPVRVCPGEGMWLLESCQVKVEIHHECQSKSCEYDWR